ncbi:DUF5983 family protein [Bacillus testis]|uniref:DUF5983 family protein n=1 Tax=Bacillus testis TaxID=1622072 RepID=UPI00067F0141|nr:hypothetical protein [Bacillus testis]
MVEKILTLSRVHIQKGTGEWLDQQANLTKGNDVDFPVFKKEDDGWFIPVKERLVTEELKEKHKVPVEFFDVLNYAVTHKCTWILIDHEGDIIEDLTQYNW